MVADDKIENKSRDFGGKAKEAFGDATSDDQLQAEGKSDQSKSDL